MLELATTLLHSLWQATLLAGLLWLVSRHRGLSPAFRYRLAYGTLLAQLALSVGTYLHYRTPAPRLEGEVKQLVIDWVTATPTGVGADFTTPTYWLHVLVLIWVVSVVVGTLRTAISFGRVRRMKSRSVPLASTPGLDVINQLVQRIGYTGKFSVRVAAVAAPLLVGFFRPVLLLPVALANQLTTEEAESVLLHELAHLRRYDHWWNLLQCLIEILFYYHPAVHWIGARIREEREYCCDDWVLAYGPGGLPYARALLHYGERAAAGNVTALSLTDGGGLLARVQRFLTHQSIPYTMQRTLLLLPVLALLVLITTAVTAPTPPFASSSPARPPAIDTLPDGTYTVKRIANGVTTEARVEDGQLRQMSRGGLDVRADELAQREPEVEQMLSHFSDPVRDEVDTIVLLPPSGNMALADTLVREVTVMPANTLASRKDYVRGYRDGAVKSLREQGVPESDLKQLLESPFRDQDIDRLRTLEEVEQLRIRLIGLAEELRNRLGALEETQRSLVPASEHLDQLSDQLDEVVRDLDAVTDDLDETVEELESVSRRALNLGNTGLGTLLRSLQDEGLVDPEPVYSLRMAQGLLIVNDIPYGREAFEAFYQGWQQLGIPFDRRSEISVSVTD